MLVPEQKKCVDGEETVEKDGERDALGQVGEHNEIVGVGNDVTVCVAEDDPAERHDTDGVQRVELVLVGA